MPNLPSVPSRWIAAFRAATTPSELAKLLDPPRSQNKTERDEIERDLRALLGDADYERLRERAKSSRAVRARALQGNVVVLPGVMGSELSVGEGDDQWKLWVHYWWIYRGYLQRLKLDASGTAPAGNAADGIIQPTGLLNEYYADIVFRLGESFNVRAFPYDWRLPLAKSADALEALIRNEFGDQQVTLVAHSMGGLVGRLLMGRQYPAGQKNPVDRLVMLGTPNYGSFEVPMIFAGIQNTVKDLIRLTGGVGAFVQSEKRLAAKRDLLRLIDTFPALYEMLPCENVPGLSSSSTRSQLYKRGVYAAFNDSVSDVHLRAARTFQQTVAPIIFPDRMVYVAGANQETVTGVIDPFQLESLDNYEITTAGDGKVPHAFGLLADVPTYFVDCDHADLPKDEKILREIDNLVLGRHVNIATDPPIRSRSLDDVRKLSQSWAIRQAEKDRRDDQRMRDLFAALPDKSRGSDSEDEPPLSPQRAETERRLVRSVFNIRGGDEAKPPSVAVGRSAPAAPVPDLRIRLVYGNIATCHDPAEPDPIDSLKAQPDGTFKNTWKDKPVRRFDVEKDAVALGKYLGTRPFAALRDLDSRISQFLYPDNWKSSRSGKTRGEQRFFLQEMIDRGNLRGDLGVPTLLPDPRSPLSTRDLVFVGMGTVGQFAESEARMSARELVWMLGQAGKKHLATILFGAGVGNLLARDAMRAFLDGAAEALQSETQMDRRLETITFVEYFGSRVREIDEVLRDETIRRAMTMSINYQPYSAKELQAIDKRDEMRLGRERSSSKDATPAENAVRVVTELIQDQYWFSALTNEASIPQRRTEVEPALIADINDELVTANAPEAQVESGKALGKLLVHPDLRRLLRSDVPIVMQVDATTARLHWEMVYRQSDQVRDSGDFLGLERGFTRQLRTRFAPPPEPPASRRRILRAMVIANPAPDAYLDGAQREGEEVVALFEQFNRLAPADCRIEVTSFIGPDEAHRASVLKKLLATEHHILHFAGHCFFDAQHPDQCGWIFRANVGGKMEILSARELRALDSVPQFVFSNACESGITPDRSAEGLPPPPDTEKLTSKQRHERTPEMPVSFAEAFFERGVRDFVCTAWKVGDSAALTFARIFYSSLLGLELDTAFEEPIGKSLTTPTDMVHAMRAARLATLRSNGGLTTWGAYQHYGNPYSRFFESKWSRTGAAAPARTVVPVGGLRDADLQLAEQVVKRHRTRLLTIPGVVDVRAGFRFENGWITDDPAIVVAVLDKNAIPADVHRLSRRIDGVVVDVVPATPLEQLRAIDPAERLQRGLPTNLDELSAPDVATRKATALLKYPKEKQALKKFDAKMKLVCHVSPDNGWAKLSEFLTGPIAQLTVAMYDFTAPHIRDQILKALGDNGKLTLVLCPFSGGAKKSNVDRGVKDNDFDEDALLAELKTKLGDRLSFAWAAVPVQGKTTNGFFPRAYHIKVAVKDGKSFWLSSGNWQSSNQPSDADFVPGETRKTFWRKYNREWNVIIEHPGLAQVFKKSIERDLDMATRLQASVRGAAERAGPGLPLLFVPLEPDDVRGDTDVVPAEPLELNVKVPIQPLLTPDNYVDFVLPLIEGAKQKLYFVNQSLTVRNLKADDTTSVLGKLTQALLKKSKDLPDVRIIVRDISGVDQDLIAMKRLGFDMNKVKVQPALHTKGIVVDSKRVLIGSQNWSVQGVDSNRDASLLIDNPRVAAYFEASFLHDWERLAKQKVTSLTNPPRLAEGAVRAMKAATGGVIAWNDYFGE
jgi:pimeloyl-ACP methyl ester carboxylesterase